MTSSAAAQTNGWKPYSIEWANFTLAEVIYRDAGAFLLCSYAMPGGPLTTRIFRSTPTGMRCSVSKGTLSQFDCLPPNGLAATQVNTINPK